MKDCNGCKYHMPNNECCIGAIEKCPLEISYEALKMLRHIFDARIDNADDDSAYIAWTSARDIVEYALADNLECLKEFDYLPTKEENSTIKVD